MMEDDDHDRSASSPSGVNNNNNQDNSSVPNHNFDNSYSYHGDDYQFYNYDHNDDDQHDAQPFFADMTLDLAEAHDIAETPEPKQRSIIEPRQADLHHLTSQMPMAMSMPMPTPTPTSMPTPTSTSTPSSSGTDDNNNNDNNNLETISTSTFETERQQQEQRQPTIFQDHKPQDDTTSATPPTSYNKIMGRVTSSDPGMSTARSYKSASNVMMRGAGGSRRTRLWPKDVAWAVSFIIFVPISLSGPLLLSNYRTGSGSESGSGGQTTATATETTTTTNNLFWIATAGAPRLATLHTLLWGFAAAFVLARILYRTAGGGDGDDARHFASQLLLASAPISVSVYIFLLAAIYWLTPNGTWMFSLIPLWYLSRDVYLFRRWKMTSTTPGGRQSFFQALTCMALDILARSLRRLPFWRCVVASLIVQFFLIAWWRAALLAAIKSGSVLWIVITAGGGKWATGTVARIMSLIAGGGIAHWFAEQSTLLLEMQEQNQNHGGTTQNSSADPQAAIQGQSLEDDDVGVGGSSSFGFANTPKDYSRDYNYDGILPEAYRTADASAYRSVVQFDDEGIDDDMSEDDEDDEAPTSFYPMASDRPGRKHQSVLSTIGTNQRRPGSSVKQLLGAGLSVSFGSVAKCGLLGGLAQFLWSQIRKIDHARATLSGLRGMEIQGSDSRPEPQGLFRRILQTINARARKFVQNNSDMAMSFVALYQMAYSPASREVALVLDERGVEPIIHDDISTHISSCVGGSVSGFIVLFTGAILAHQRNNTSPSVPDTAVVLDMLLAFVFCYTLIFTVMEPLRASIKAVYVSFAQHPESLRASFPLIYHRLTRMSQNNMS